MSEETKAKLKDILEWIYCIIIAVALALLIRYYVGTPTIVKQQSMKPTFMPNDRLVLNRIYRTAKTIPSRGEIITFEAPSTTILSPTELQESQIARYENEQKSLWEKFSYYVLEVGKKSYIKRVIGLPGEHISIKDGKVYVNDKVLEEKYLPSGVVTDGNGRGNCIDLVVPENAVFAMGDNRTESADSRYFGCVPLEKIESKVWIRIWPLNLFGKIDK